MPADLNLLLHRCLTTVVAQVAAVRPDQVDAPTPCAGIDAGGMVAHLLTVVERVARVGRDDDPFGFPEHERTEVLDGVVDRLRDLVRDAETVWAKPGALDRILHLPWTTAPGREVLPTYLGELTVHTWDLQQAVGVAAPIDPEVADVALAAMRRALPADGRAPAFDPVVVVNDDASALDRLVAWTGRHP